MTKTQLLQILAERVNLSKAQVNLVLENLTEVAGTTLKSGESFTVPNLVKFTVKTKSATGARTGINPFTKEPMEIAAKPASKKVRAAAIGDLKKSVAD